MDEKDTGHCVMTSLLGTSHSFAHVALVILNLFRESRVLRDVRCGGDSS